MRYTLLASTALLALGSVAMADVDIDAVVDNYANIAQAGYEDSLTLAVELRDALAAFTAEPTEATLAAAKSAWLRARVPYQQTEAYRFGNPTVDDWEGKVNAWPLDEGLIDYVAHSADNPENPFAAANIIASTSLTVGSETIDTTEITPALLESLHELDGIEENVSTGYHAIEFLLWGQDLNGTDAGSGVRPATDFDVDNCTGGNCERRAEYLMAAADLLISDLEDMVANWSEGGQGRADLAAGDPLVMAFTGMGSLSFGEQAGERMQLGLLLHDPEESHDCFSDNSSVSHYYDGLGIRNVYTGRYVRIDGSVVEGPSPMDVVAEADPVLAANLLADMDATMSLLGALKTAQESGTAFDQLIGMSHPGNALVQDAIDHLVAQTRNIERAVTAVGLEGVTIEGSDSLAPLQ